MMSCAAARGFERAAATIWRNSVAQAEEAAYGLGLLCRFEWHKQMTIRGAAARPLWVIRDRDERTASLVMSAMPPKAEFDLEH